jgi:capsular exopolysaccharide synthesis family protein
MRRERTLLPRRVNQFMLGESIDRPYALSMRGFQAAPPSEWTQFVKAAARHKFAVLLITALGLAGGIALAMMLDSQYTANSILWVAMEGRRTPDEEPLAGEGVVVGTAWTELVRANTVVENVVRQLRLHVRPHKAQDADAFTNFAVAQQLWPGEYRVDVDVTGRNVVLRRADGTVVERTSVGSPLGADAGFVWQPSAQVLRPGRRIEFEVTTPYDAARQLAKDLRVKLDPAGSFMRIELTGDNAALTTATVNAIADRVVAVAAELKVDTYKELAKILEEQYAHAENALRSAEIALRDYQTSTAEARVGPAPAMPSAPAGGTVVDLNTGVDPNLARAIGARMAIEQVRRDRQAIEQALATPSESGLQAGAMAAVNAVKESPYLSQALQEVTTKQAELRSLRNRYTDESAPVQQKRAELDSLERIAVPRLAGQLVNDLRTRETTLNTGASEAMQHMRRLPNIALEEARLGREVASTEEVFANVRKRYEATRLALISSLPDIRILDKAVAPRRPASDYGPLVVLLSVLTSFGVAVVGVTLRDRVDPKVRYPEQITNELRLPILGALPHLPRRAHRGREGAAEIAESVIEAVRGLRVRVLHAYGGRGPLLLTVTSPGVGEGKSFVAANLALSYAHAGYETLLIDGDVRRGTLHRLLGVSRRPGFTDILSGRVPQEAALRNTSEARLSFIPAGTWMQRAPELLLTSQLRNLIAGLRSTYQVIIVDSAPLSAGADPLALSAVTGHLLLVLRCGETNLPMAMAKLEEVDTLPVHTIGAVLNDVRRSNDLGLYTYDTTEYPRLDEHFTEDGIEDRPLSIVGGR